MFNEIVPGVAAAPESPFGVLAADRAELIAQLSKAKHVDVLVIGGGIHGACVARLAALNGLKTALLERADYASGTSSRSSKMVHGGLRYLEMLDLRQVAEGLKARQDLLQTAPHIVSLQEFLIPVSRGHSWERMRMALGLRLYDLLARTPQRRLWVDGDRLPEALRGAQLSGAFRYFDGLMRDARLVIENIIAARQEGALCLNYASVDSMSSLQESKVSVGWTDTLTRKQYEISAGVVVNCAGPWVAKAGRLRPSPELASKIRFSQGTHLLFRTPWKGPALFLPLADKGRYYWIWPHFAGTLVGTTERELEELPDDPQPTEGEIAEILERLERDVPASGLSKDTAHYAFAGIRTLALRHPGAPVSQLSRRHQWSLSGGTLSLIGGKFTTAAWTAFEGLSRVFELARLGRKPVPLTGRPLPGAGLFQESTTEFRKAAEAHGVSPELQQRAISRLGSLVRFLSTAEAFEPLEGQILRGEVELALAVEQAETLEDLMRRRLELEYFPGHGLEALNSIAAVLKAKRPAADVDKEMESYRNRLDALARLLA